jgi:hypothetical protein
MSQINPMLVKQLTQGTPSTIVAAATTTGVALSSPFAVPMRMPGLQRSIDFNCTGTYSVCTAVLEQSFDGGNSWQAIGPDMDLFGNPSGNLANLNGVVAFVTGVLYMLSISSFTGTSITVQAMVS